MSEHDTTRRAPPTARTLQEQAVRGSLWTLLSSASSLPVSLLSLVIAGRLLGPTGFGNYSLYSFYLPLGLSMLDVGMTATFSWSATHGHTSVEHDAVAPLRASATWNLLKLPIAVGVVALLFASHPAAAALLAAGIASFLLALPLGIALTADRQYKTLALCSLINVVVGAVGVTVASVVTRDASWAVAGFWTGRIAVLAFAWPRTPLALRRPASHPGSLRMERAAWTFGASSYIAELLRTWVLGRSELLFQKAYGDAFAQGRFAVVTTVAQRATVLADSLYGSLAIAMVALRTTEPEKFVRGFSRSIRLTTLLATASAATATPVLSRIAGPVFGSQYGIVVIPTALLLQVALLRTALEPLLTWVYSERRNVAIVVPGAIAAAVDVGLALLLIPDHPFTGAVIANGTTGVVYLVLTAICAGLPRDAVRELLTCLRRFVPISAASAALAALPLPGPVAVEVVVGLAAALLVATVISALQPPLLPPAEIASISESTPRWARPLLGVTTALFNGRSRSGPAQMPAEGSSDG